MTRLRDLPIGTKIKDTNTKYNGHTLVWIIADKNHQGYPANTVTLVSEKVVGTGEFNCDMNYKTSKLRTLINSDTGFMKDFSSDFKNAIVYTSVGFKGRTSSDIDTVVDKIFLASSAEVGISNYADNIGNKLALFTDDHSRIAKGFNNENSSWWLRSGYHYQKTAAVVSPEGSDAWGSNYNSTRKGIRPFCNMKSDISVLRSTDSDGVYSISWQRPPIIESSTSENMGLKDKEFEFTYRVTDENYWQMLTAEEYLDDIRTKDFVVDPVSTYTFSLSRLAYQKLLNGNHTIKIVADDNEGGVAEKVFNFRKNETKILFELQRPLQADAMVTKALINLVGSIPEKAILKIEACNNGNDANPTWEDVTDKVVENKKIFFSNKQKTASNWGFNIRVSVERNGAIGECYISSIGGNFE